VSRSRRPGAPAKPRLLILSPDFPPDHGGVQTLVYELAMRLQGAFDVRVVTLVSDRSVSRQHEPIGTGTPHELDGVSELAIERVGARASSHAARILALNAAALRHAVRRRPDLTLSAHVIVSPAAFAIRRMLGARTVQYFYASEMFGKPRLAAFAAARADLAIAISSYTAALVVAAGAQPQRLRVIPPGIALPPAPAPPRDSARLRAQRPTILTVAQLLYRYKGHDVLIRALAGIRARVPDVEWVVIGDGPLRPRLEALASSLGLDGAVRFLGDVSAELRDEWLRRADLMAMPSRLPGEGFGIALLEGGAHGMPVLAGNVGGPLDAVVDGESGLLVDPTDVDAVAAGVTRLLLDRDLARRLGENGAERARAFAWPAIADRVEAAMLETVAGQQ
jgi:phosphatidylinositol alpha-1,6-mannosyltransferase